MNAITTTKKSRSVLEGQAPIGGAVAAIMAVVLGTILSVTESKSAELKDAGVNAAERELIRDPHIRGGFLLLDP